ncbi:MAG: GAF domain-containing sensor histidine kinase [Dehalococcoidia bacterium]
MGDEHKKPRLWHWRHNIHMLRWVTIILPILFLALVDVVRNLVFEERLSGLADFFATYAVIAVAVGIFSYTIFGFISRLQRGLAERNQELGALLAVGKAVSSSLDLDAVLSRSLETILEVTSTDAAEIWLLEDNQELVMKCHHGARREAFLERTRFKVGEGLPGLVAQGEKSLLIHDLPSVRRFLRRQVVEAGFNTFYALPLKYQSRLTGVLAVAAFSPGVLRESSDISLLEGIGERLAVAIEATRLHQQVQDLATLQERERIAREMHDGMAQLLGYINTQTIAVKKLLSDESFTEARAELTKMEDVARDLYTDVREGILGLRVAARVQPGLPPALREYAERYMEMSDVKVEVDVSPDAEEIQLAPSAEIQLIRIVQEALSNVRRHSRATNARIIFERDNHELYLTVADDGRGFDLARLPSTGWPRFGLQTMRERAEAIGGSLRIDTALGKGTKVEVCIPLLLPES